MVVACHYSPPGNIFGKFNQNVLAPKGESSSWMDARSISLRAGENGKLFFAFLYFYHSVFLSFCLSVFLSFYLSVFLSVFLSAFLSLSLFIFVHLSSFKIVQILLSHLICYL